MLLKIPNNKKSTNTINNNYFSYFKEIKLDQYNNYNPKINKSKTKKKKFTLNPTSHNSKESLINKNLNNSSMNINYNISFNNNLDSINKKINSENNSLKKNKQSGIVSDKNNSSSYNIPVNSYRNNKSQNNKNKFSKTNFDFFTSRYNLYKNKNINKNNNIKKIFNMKSLESSNRMNKKSIFENKNNRSELDIMDKIVNIKKIIKPNIFAMYMQKSKTPITTSRKSKNNSKSKNKNLSNNNSREKKTNNNKVKINLLHSGKNLNVNNIIRKQYDMKHNNIRTKFFQANNIFSKFKPKNKKQTIIHLEELQMNKNPLFYNYLNLNKKDINKENKNNNNNVNQDKNLSYFDQIHPKIIQKDMNNITINEESIKGLNFSNTERQYKRNSNIKPSKLNNVNNNSSNDSNTQSQSTNLNIHSAISLNSYSNINLNINNLNNKNNSSLITSLQSQSFKGKQIKCIHDISKTGLAGEEKKINQDRYFIFRNFVEGFDNIFMGVCDGHGYYGNEISEYIKENLPMDLNRIIKTRKLDLNKDDLKEVIINTFLMENNSLLRNKQIDSDLSGSTCVSVIYTPKKLIIANVGDSRCVLGSCTSKGEWKFENLSKDHKPSDKEEAERIKKHGGRIKPMTDDDGNFIGPLRVYMKDKELPGLAMTRSFGDYFASLAGTIAVPEIKEHILVPEDKFIILASDGLFEFINSEEVGNIIKGYYEKNDIVGCCEYLYKESYRKWIKEEEDTVDDITIILVFFEG